MFPQNGALLTSCSICMISYAREPLILLNVHFADLLLVVSTDMNEVYNNNGKGKQPLHNNVVRAITSPGVTVPSPAGPAIGCSDDAQCDIKWEINLGNNTCPCAFNISCCTNGVTISFWWSWGIPNESYYPLFLDIGGIYIFYNVNYKPSMAYRIYGSPDEQWYSSIPVPFGTWQHVAIMIHITQLTSYVNGRFYRSRGLGGNAVDWFPRATTMNPEIWLKPIDGNYSFGKMHLWKNKQTALFLWRQHYEEIEANDVEWYQWHGVIRHVWNRIKHVTTYVWIPFVYKLISRNRCMLT